MQWLFTKIERQGFSAFREFKLKKLLILVLFTFGIGFADTLEKIESIIQKSKSIKAEFIQISKIEGFEESKFKGFLYILKPDKVKIEYFYPEKNIIFVEKNKVIIYNPKDNQAAISELSDQFIVVKIFNMIAKNQSFKELFDVKKKEENKNNIIIYLIPKENQQIKSLKIIFSKKNFKIEKIQILDTENNKISLIFNKFEYLNKQIPVKFKLPKDVQIFRQ